MKVFREINELRTYLKSERLASARQGKFIQTGLVPTMGYLHEGHASLLRKARGENDLVVLSIFVNPIQFGPNEDLDKYPRDEKNDLQLAEREGADAVFLPSVEEMYPVPTKTKVLVQQLTSRLCGASRPGHFDGVTTVVSKLMHIVQPDNAYFGQKDAQQAAVISQMVADLNFDVRIVPCPIVREKDGLALSSRNVYLSPEDRNAALVLSRSLLTLQSKVEAGEAVTVGQASEDIIHTISVEPRALIDYVEIVTFPGLSAMEPGQVLAEAEEEVLIAVAVKFGNTRLIDNIIVTKKGEAIHV
ncbi:pantothenate synthetase [Fontibacillus panacisegetis]|uniref:Pantothenate synthetase n=1 Tax=Fontibacillus panacisegetis TaxID=670482 RepID=A0A1G7KYX0_9BACL|nr:pantoate--beta-alanine ligase [Fontibacillus panacisegetis]SDF42321.1 pantothenate synthetase [Fontibacillus panacisegetis]